MNSHALLRSKFMPRHNYKVELQWTAWGLDSTNPETIAQRIQLAAGAAGRHNVNGPNDVPLDPSNNNHRHDHGDNSHITWHVHGDYYDVQAMVNRWGGAADGALPAFNPPNVTVLSWSQE
jgi:hypothetical protein